VRAGNREAGVDIETLVLAARNRQGIHAQDSGADGSRGTAAALLFRDPKRPLDSDAGVRC